MSLSTQEARVSHSAAGGSDGLQLAPPMDHYPESFPEVVDNNSYPEAVHNKSLEADKHYYNPALGNDSPEAVSSAPNSAAPNSDIESSKPKVQKKLICGLTRRMFLLVVIGVIVSVGGVGGGVGRSLAGKDKSKSDTSTTSSIPVIPGPTPTIPTSARPSGDATPVASLPTNSLMSVSPAASVMPSRLANMVVALPTMSASTPQQNMCKGRICSHLLTAVAESITSYRVLGIGNEGNLWTARSESFSFDNFNRTEQSFGQGPPTAIAKAKSLVDVFFVGRNSSVQHQTWDGLAWSGLEDLSPQIFSSLSLVQTASRLQVFAIGTGNSAYMKAASLTADAPFTNEWEYMSGIFNTSITGVAWKPEGRDRTDVFGVGLDGQMFQGSREARDTSWNRIWNPWGGSFLSEPSIAKYNDTRLDVFGIGTDRAAWTRSFGVMYEGDTDDHWRSLGGMFLSSLSTVVGKNGKIDVFGLGIDGAIYTRQLINGTTWSLAWLSLGGSFNSAPEVVSTDAELNGLAVFAVGNDSAIWTRARLRDEWYSWQSLGGQFQVV